MRLLEQLEEEQLELVKQAVRQGGETISIEDERFLRNSSKKIIEEILRDTLTGRLDNLSLKEHANEYTQAIYSAFYESYDQLVKVKHARAYVKANAESLQTKGGIRGITKAWLNRVSIAQEQSINATNRMWGDAFAKIKTSGGTAINPDQVNAAQRLFLNEIGGGDKLRQYLLKQHGVEDVDRQIMTAMIQGHHEIPILNYIGKAAVLQKQMLDDYIGRIDPQYKPIANLAGSIKMDQIKLQRVGLQGFREDMLGSGLYKHLSAYKRMEASPKYADGVPNKEIERMLDEMYLDSVSIGKLQPRKESSGSVLQQQVKRFEFEDVDAEWEFISRYGDLSNGAAAGVMGARQAQVSKMAADSILGRDWGHTLQEFARTIDETTTAWDAKEIQDYIQSRAGFLQGILDGGSYESTLDHVIKGTDQFITATFTGAAYLRNLLIDNSMYTGVVRASFAKTSPLYDYMSNFSKLLTGMVTPGRVQEMADLIEAHGIAASMSQKQVVEGVANSLALGNRRGAKWAQNYNRGMNWFSSATSMVSGADRGNRAARVMGAMQFGQALQASFKQAWSDLDPGVRSYYQRYGVGEPEFDLLKTAKTVDDPRTGTKFLIDTNALLDDTFVVKSIRRPNETSHQARVRLRNTVIALMEEGTSELVPRVQSSDVFSFTKHTNPLSKLITSAVYRFGPITMRQFNGTIRALRRGSGLDDADTSIGAIAEAAIKSPVAFAKLTAYMTTAGLMGMWAYDIKNGKTPREMSPLTVWEALNFSGASGAMGMIYMSLLYNQAIMSSPHNSVGMSLIDFMKAMADIENPDQRLKLSRQARRLITRMGGFTNLWYTKAATDKAINTALGLETSTGELRRLEERGQRKFLD